MRQKDDLEYVDILNRIRFGVPNEQDIQKLNQRIIPKDNLFDKFENATNSFLEIAKTQPAVICLFPLTKSVDTFNGIINKKLNIDIKSIKADDFNPKDKFSYKQTTIPNKKFLKAKKLKISQTAGLEEVLNIGINSRVMLRRNLDVSKGLCNGAIGTVTNLIYDHFNKLIIRYITVKFDNCDVEYNIERIVADYEKQRNIYVSRSQFPLSLAWALTIHKSQGLSLDAIMIDLGNDIFESGMAYVALSRGRKLTNVYLIDFNPNKLICEINCVNEYNRLLIKNNTNASLITKVNILPDKYNIIKTPILFHVDLINKNAKKQFDNTLDKQTITQKKVMKFNKEVHPKNKNVFTNIPMVDINNNYFLKLRNENENACYANVILQALISFGRAFFEKVFTFN